MIVYLLKPESSEKYRNIVKCIDAPEAAWKDKLTMVRQNSSYTKLCYQKSRTMWNSITVL